MRLKVAIMITVLAAGFGGCGGDTGGTRVVATVADHAFEGAGLSAGAPLAGASLRIYLGDTVVLESTLDGNGTVTVEPEPGTYAVQVDLPSTDGCFWGETVFDVVFPTDRLELAASYICPGGGS